MNIIVATIGVLMVINRNVNAKSVEEISREITELKDLCSQRIAAEELARLNLIVDVKQNQDNNRNTGLEKSYHKYESAVEYIEGLIPAENENAELNHIYTVCLERSKEKLTTEYEDLEVDNCIEQDLVPLDSVVAKINETVQLGREVLAMLNSATTNCNADDDEKFQQCVDSAMSSARVAYNDFDQMYQKDQEMVVNTRPDLMMFSCFSNRVCKFFENTNLIEARGKKCIEDADLNQVA